MLNNLATILDQGVAASTNSYESIMTTTVGSGGSASVTFSSIPATYKHLQIRALMSDTGTGSASMTTQFNGDTGANYATHILIGNGSAASSAAITSDTKTFTGYFYQGTNTFGAAIVDILDYANTNKYKTTRALSGFDTNGTVSGYGGRAALISGNWRSTSAITSITFTVDNAANYSANSKFSLYGIKG